MGRGKDPDANPGRAGCRALRLINASAADMAKWMAMWEEGGKLPDGSQLLSAAAVHELWNARRRRPRPMPSAPLPCCLPEPTFQDYALGWFVEDDYGHTVVEHAGAVFGGLAALYFIPGQACRLLGRSSTPRTGPRARRGRLPARPLSRPAAAGLDRQSAADAQAAHRPDAGEAEEPAAAIPAERQILIADRAAMPAPMPIPGTAP